MKYYRDEAGNYLGGWDEEATPPDGAIEVPFPPDNAGQLWQMPDGPWLALPPQPYTLPVAVLWLRMSDEEAEEFDGVVSIASPLRLRKAFGTASSLNSEAELFTFVRNILVGLFGEERADEIMAPPDGETMSAQIELE